MITGANKGIGLETARQLASHGVTVILTARDEKKGIGAVEFLHQVGFSNVVFHQLDVRDYASVASLAHFIQNQFGKLDILGKKKKTSNTDATLISLDRLLEPCCGYR